MSFLINQLIYYQLKSVITNVYTYLYLTNSLIHKKIINKRQRNETNTKFHCALFGLIEHSGQKKQASWVIFSYVQLHSMVMDLCS